MHGISILYSVTVMVKATSHWIKFCSDKGLMLEMSAFTTYICLSGQLVCLLLILLVIQILFHQLIMNGLTCGRLQSTIFLFVNETC